MYWKLFKNDIKHNFFQMFPIAFFIVLSTAFLATSGQLTVRLADSVNRLLEQSETPHLLQMHRGEIDEKRLLSFVDSHPEIEEFQILNFLNIDNALLSFNGGSLKDSVYDNGFSVQSPRFDYLFDLEGELITAKKGEVYVPIFYRTAGLVKSGDTLTIKDRSFHVAGFVRDSQMNAPLSVSKRFVINEEDYEAIKNLGTLEYLIEFRVKNIEDSSKIEAEYSKRNLESVGPPFISYALFRLVNAFSDGITIVTLMLVSFLVIGISLLCIRFSLLANLEEDHRELAVLKAIGISFRDIRTIFLGKYIFIAGISTIFGFLLSFLIRIPLLENMEVFFGETKESFLSVFTALLLSFIVFTVIFLHMNRIAKQLKNPDLHSYLSREEPVFPTFFEDIPQNLRYLTFDLFARRKAYAVMVTVFILCVFLLTLPMSIHSTIIDKRFVNYLGIGTYDIRIDISQAEEHSGDMDLLLAELKKDSSISKFDIFTGKSVDYKTQSGSTQKIWVDFGNPESFPIKYLQGSAPAKDNEISLSKLNADDLSKKVGDRLTLIIDGKEKTLTVSGIFSDLTNGGKSAKANFNVQKDDAARFIIPIELNKSTSAAEWIDKYRPRYSFAKFSDTEAYLKQIFGTTIDMVKTIAWISLGACSLLIFLIVTLFMRMLYLKDLEQIALLKSIGFTDRNIRKQYLIRTSVLLIIGLCTGTTLSRSVTDRLGAAFLSMIGIHGVQFIRDPAFSYLAIPVILFICAISATYLGLAGLNNIDIAQLLKEDI